MFPATIAAMGGNISGEGWLAQLSTFLRRVSNLLMPGEPLYLVTFATLIIVFAFFYTAMVFNSADSRKPEEVRRADPRHSSRQVNSGLRRWRDDATHRDRSVVSGGGLSVADDPADRLECAVLFRRNLAADRGGRGDGFHRADSGAPGVVSVREPAEEDELEELWSQWIRPLRQLRRMCGSRR